MELNSEREINVSDTDEYKQFSIELDYYIDFFQSLSELFFYNGRLVSFMVGNRSYILDTSLIDSSAQTLKSIKLCCSIGSFSDANTLVRKLRDDLVLYVFILNIINNRKSFVEEDLEKIRLENAEKFSEAFLNVHLNSVVTEDEQAVEAWLNNTVSELERPIKKKLEFGNYMTVLKQNSNISQILTDYKLQDYWGKLRIRLNNYVHNNGKHFTLQNFISHNDKNVKIHLENINIRTSYISSFFLVLLLMVQSSLISSTDLIDYLDSNVKPPDDCQYFVAPFVQEFIDKKVSKLHPELKQYLIDNNINGMQIE